MGQFLEFWKENLMTSRQSRNRTGRGNLRSKREDRNRKVVIAEGGSKNETEKNYFLMIKKSVAFSNSVLKVDTKGGATDLTGMIRRAKTMAQSKDFNIETDRIYILFDIDSDSNKWELKIKQMEKAKDKKYIVFIPSNPTFEIWLLYHFCYTKRHFPTPDSLRNELKKHVPNYDKGYSFERNSSIHWVAKLDQAISHAQQSVKNGSGSPYHETGTLVHLLFEDV